MGEALTDFEAPIRNPKLPDRSVEIGIAKLEDGHDAAELAPQLYESHQEQVFNQRRDASYRGFDLRRESIVQLGRIDRGHRAPMQLAPQGSKKVRHAFGVRRGVLQGAEAVDEEALRVESVDGLEE